MNPLPHRYQAQLTGGPHGYGAVSAEGLPAIRTAAPPQFDGPGDAWSPEQLFLAAVGTCYLFTLRAVARAFRLEFISLDLDMVGTVDRDDRVTRFTEITLRPRPTVDGPADHEKALHVLEKTQRACLVSASISTPVHLDPEVIDGRHQSAA
jgi:organic hydroperoxide reductase OsmC/OhrA